MTKAYSNDLRERVATFALANRSTQLAAQTFSVSKATAVRWAQKLRDTGTVAPGKIGGHRPHLLRGERDWLLKRIASEPHATLRLLLAELEMRGIAVSYGTLWNFVHDQELSFKKTVHASEQQRPDVARRRYWWKKYQGRIDPSRLVFIDETPDRVRGRLWTKTNRAPIRRWCLKGKNSWPTFPMAIGRP